MVVPNVHSTSQEIPVAIDWSRIVDEEWFDATVVIPEDTSHYAECIEVVAYRCAAALYEAGYRKVEKGE